MKWLKKVGMWLEKKKFLTEFHSKFCSDMCFCTCINVSSTPTSVFQYILVSLYSHSEICRTVLLWETMLPIDKTIQKAKRPWTMQEVKMPAEEAWQSITREYIKYVLMLLGQSGNVIKVCFWPSVLSLFFWCFWKFVVSATGYCAGCFMYRVISYISELYDWFTLQIRS